MSDAWKQLVADLAAIDPMRPHPMGYESCAFCYAHVGDGHADSCVWSRADQLVNGRPVRGVLIIATPEYDREWRIAGTKHPDGTFIPDLAAQPVGDVVETSTSTTRFVPFDDQEDRS